MRQKSEPLLTRLYWRPHSSRPGDCKRVWLNSWHGDVFELMTAEEFAEVQRVCERFNIPLTQWRDDDD